MKVSSSDLVFKVHDSDLIYSSPKEQITGQEQADLLVFEKHSPGPLTLLFWLKPYLSVLLPSVFLVVLTIEEYSSSYRFLEFSRAS